MTQRSGVPPSGPQDAALELRVAQVQRRLVLELLQFSLQRGLLAEQPAGLLGEIRAGGGPMGVLQFPAAVGQLQRDFLDPSRVLAGQVLGDRFPNGGLLLLGKGFLRLFQSFAGLRQRRCRLFKVCHGSAP